MKPEIKPINPKKGADIFYGTSGYRTHDKWDLDNVNYYKNSFSNVNTASNNVTIENSERIISGSYLSSDEGINLINSIPTEGEKQKIKNKVILL